ncbi:hypothetical protein BHAOGJBA_1306 [Methylobacterium hispanicum]|uniref:Membrane-anchored protein n=1 Tax=Methylobacterium hispanicum TaxID=270350 RepID=A0AAV4ZH85_9HYPH|nr:GDYXXLXY domain-containing protein [Methylobacterium hispanicum]GJD87801.1 hypothetical protein BHAOGJBA_1306 [Methylobacterium hispanicum]
MNPKLASKLPFAGFLLLLAIQTGPAILTGVAATRHLEEGTAVELAVVPRDPRDLFKGEYSVLAYELGRHDGPVGAEAWTAVRGCGPGRDNCYVGQGTPVYAELVAVDGDLHAMKRLAFAKPTPGSRYIRGETVSGQLWRGNPKSAGGKPCPDGEVCFKGAVSFGIERFYGPQGEPAKVDRLPRDRLRVRVRLDDEGRAQLDAILLDGAVQARTARLW